MNVLAQEGRFDDANAGSRLQIWAEGVHGDNRRTDRHPTAVFRLHRDGAATLATAHEANPLPMYSVARELNAHIVYLTWLWKKFGLEAPIEIRVALENVNQATVVMGPF
jgi:hypothetical protein